MSSPQVSVVMPIFNRSEAAARAVRSVLGQEGVDFELIVVDDASTEPADALYQQVEAAGHRVLRLTKNGGPGRARNHGCTVARGEWLAFLDSDDHWLPGKLSHHLASLQASGLSIGQTDEIWYRDGERVNPPKAHRISGGDLFRRSLRAVCVSSSTVMLERELFERMGGFDESFFVCEDYDLWLRVAATESFDYCPELLVVKYGGHDDQLSRALPAMDRYRILAIVKGLSSEFSSLPEEKQEWARFELERKLRILSKGSAKRGMTRVVELCEEIKTTALEGDWKRTLALARELVGEWSVRP